LTILESPETPERTSVFKAFLYVYESTSFEFDVFEDIYVYVNNAASATLLKTTVYLRKTDEFSGDG